MKSLKQYSSIMQGKKVNFNNYMRKLNDTVKIVLLKKKRIKVKKERRQNSFGS